MTSETIVRVSQNQDRFECCSPMCRATAAVVWGVFAVVCGLIALIVGWISDETSVPWGQTIYWWTPDSLRGRDDFYLVSYFCVIPGLPAVLLAMTVSGVAAEAAGCVRYCRSGKQCFDDRPRSAQVGFTLMIFSLAFGGVIAVLLLTVWLYTEHADPSAFIGLFTALVAVMALVVSAIGLASATCFCVYMKNRKQTVTEGGPAVSRSQVLPATV